MVSNTFPPPKLKSGGPLTDSEQYELGDLFEIILNINGTPPQVIVWSGKPTPPNDPILGNLVKRHNRLSLKRFAP